MLKNMKVSVIIPHKDAPQELLSLVESLKKQTLLPAEVIVTDSSEESENFRLAQKIGGKVFRISPAQFNHGETRTFAARKAEGEVLVFFTQDARPAHKRALENLVNSLSPAHKIVAAYGRQVSPPSLGLLPFLHRLFNYPPRSQVVSAADIEKLGLRAAFFSNSFGAYLKEALRAVGWFPKVPALEDQYVAAKFLLRGWQICYNARAVVFHGHAFSFLREFRRYSSMGRFYAENPWLKERFGRVEGEAWRYFFFIWRELKRRKKLRLFPIFFMQQVVRFGGYQWGKRRRS